MTSEGDSTEILLIFERKNFQFLLSEATNARIFSFHQWSQLESFCLQRLSLYLSAILLGNSFHLRLTLEHGEDPAERRCCTIS
jgi:hypothetical protein